MRTISLTTAKHELSKLIEEVESGESFLITRRGRPIAKLVPHAADRASDPAWAASCRRMTARLEEGASLGGLRVEREALYES